METRAIYTERKTFVKYDDNHYLLYLNEEVLENHVPEGHGGEPEPEPCTAYAYTGTLIEAADATYERFVSGLVRTRYSADRVEAITLNKLGSDTARMAEFEAEFEELERYRSDCKARVRALLGMPESVSNTL